jgi:AcrR family transcriptional regulator
MSARSDAELEPSARRPKASRIGGDLTREKILNAAEALFAHDSFDSVSLREIALRANVALALASYHFGYKEALFEAVVARRADVLRRMRTERLGALVEPTAAQLLDAFMAPLFEMAGSREPGWTDYLRVLARLGEQERWLQLLSRYFDDTARAFIVALQKALPNADAQEIARGFTMMLDVMLRAVSQHRRIDNLTDGAARASELDKAYPALLQFVSAGMASFDRPRRPNKQTGERKPC